MSNNVQKKISRLMRFIEWLYGKNNLMQSHDGYCYPVLFIKNNETDPDKILASIKPDDRSFTYFREKIKSLTNKSEYLWNGSTYVLRKINNNPTRITCSIGNYFDTLIMSTEFNAELLKAVSEHTVPSIIYQSMPLRNDFHAQQRGDIAVETAWKCDGISAALSVSCLMAIKHNNSYHGCFQCRSQNVAEDAGLYHVIPSMVLQPEKGKEANADNFDIKSCILREITEELFAVSEGDPEWKNHPAIVDLYKLLDRGCAELKITGFAMSLTNMRPEILAVLIIHDESWYATYADVFKVCPFEYQGSTNKILHDLDKNELLGPTGLFSVENSVVSGAACIIAGIDQIEKRK